MQLTATDQARLVSSDTVEYTYDSFTTVEYSLTYTGFKEDIVVSRYTGQTSYPFRLETNGLLLQEADGSFYLVDDAGQIKATIGDIIIFTADERNNAFGRIEATTVRPGQEYILDIQVDAAYLADPATVYPIRIDPTVEINYDSNSAGIQDVTINSNAGSSATSNSLSIGLRDPYGISRVLMKFPGLLDASGNLTLPANAVITSASVKVRDLLCESQEMDIYCYPFTGTAWSDTTASWTALTSQSWGSQLCKVTMGYEYGEEFDEPHWYHFDITDAVQGWVDGTLDINKGVIFKASSALENGSAYQSRTLGSYNRSRNRPALEITYLASRTIKGNNTILEGETSTLTVSSGEGIVTWDSNDYRVATVDNNGVVTAVKAGTAQIGVFVNGYEVGTYEISVIIPNGVYYLKTNNGYYLSTDGTSNNHANVSVQSLGTADHERHSCTWRIQHLKGTYYRLYPIYDRDLSLSVTSGNADLLADSYTEALNEAEYWSISYGINGYQLKYMGDSNNCLAPASNTVAPGVNVITCAGSATAHENWILDYRYVTYSTYIYYATLISRTPEQIIADFTKATSYYAEEFGITFNLNHIYSSSLLNLDPACLSSNADKVCLEACGDPADCPTTHHRSANRLLTIHSLYMQYVMRVVDYRLCALVNGEHSAVHGLAELYGTNTVVSYGDPSVLISAMQHELAHNLGASHDTCTDHSCTLNYGWDKFCKFCEANILAFAY